VRTLFAVFLTMGLLASAGLAQPKVTQVSNAASSALPPLQNANIAQGSYFAIYGSGFGADSSVCGANYGNCYWNPYPLPTSIKGTSVSVTVSGTTKAAYIEFAAAFSSTYSQINAVLPSDTPMGSGSLTVTSNGQISATFPITVVPSSFGTFTFNSAGTGPGIITDANYHLLTPFHTAKPGQTLILWGTGLGPVPDASAEAATPPTQTNLCATASSCPVTVWVGGQKASVPYAGRASYTAEDQIVFVVPQVLTGCYVQVAVQTGSQTGSVVGNFTSMPVDPAGATCSDAPGIGIDYNDIASVVANKGSAKVLAVSMLSNYLNLNIPLIGSVPWDNDTITGQIGTFSASVLDAFQGFALAPSVGNCTVSPFLQYPPAADPAAASATFLNAGSQLSFQGPNGAVSVGLDVDQAGKDTGYGGTSGGDPVGGKTIQELIATCPKSNGCIPYFLTPTFGISSGTYTVTGAGGSDVGAISGNIQVSSEAASFKWTNQSSVTANPIPRNSPLTITWTGGDPAGFVDITAIASTLQSGVEPLPSTPGILVECIAAVGEGKFTIPTYVLQSLPSTASSMATVPPGELLVGPASGAQKIATPTGLDAAYIFYHFIQGQNVSWQ